MAIYYARKTGNVNATDVWATTPSGTASDVFSSFTNQDILVANSFTITFNVNTTVGEIRNDTTGGATNGGSFSLNGGITLTALVNGIGSSVALLSCNAGSAMNIVGDIQLGTLFGSAVGLISYGGAGSLNVTGNWYNYGPNPILYRSSSGTVNITGNLVAVGNTVTGGVIRFESSSTYNITGNVIAIGGPALFSFSGTSSIINIIGIAIAGNNHPAIAFNQPGNTATITITRVRGNGFGPGSVGMGSNPAITAQQTTTVRVYEIEYGPLGQSPTSGPVELIGANSNVAVFATRFGNPKTLVDLNNSVNLVPTSGNVRSGVAYNYGNDTGSCVVPHPNSVVYGVPVDNTAGSGLLSPVAVWNALTNAIGTSGSIAERLKNCSTVSTVGKQLEGVL